MPPKRKRTGEVDAPSDMPKTRTTRSSAAPKGDGANGDTSAPADPAAKRIKTKAIETKAIKETEELAPSVKKSKTTRAAKLSTAPVKAKDAAPAEAESATTKPKASRSKAKTATTHATAAGTSATTTTRGSTSTKVPENSPLPAPATFPASSSVPAVPPSATPTAKTSPPPATPATQPTRSSTKTKTSTNANLDALEPYTASRTAALFDSYADEDEPDVIGPEGLERLCGDAGVPMDGVGPLVFAWLVGAKEMGKIARAEWEKGMGAMQISSVPALKLALVEMQDLLMTDKPAVKASSITAPTAKGKRPSAKHTNGETYDRTKYYQCAADRRTAFAKMYNFCFALAKPEQSRNLDMDIASAFWSVLLAPRYPIAADILEFVTETGSYKAANKDLWSMVLDFCETVSPDLTNFEADGAWPTMIDEFVGWKRAKTAS